MLKEHNKKFNRIFKTADLLIILGSFWAAYYLRLGMPPSFSDLPIQYQVFFPAYLMAWFYLSYRFDLYRGRRTGKLLKEAWDVAKTVVLCLVLAGGVGFFLRDYPLSRIFLLDLWILQTLTLIIFRFSLREFLKYIRKRGYNFRNILIVGWNERSANFLKWVKESPELGLRVIGFIDGPNGSHPLTNQVNHLGELKNLEPILRNQVVDEVLVFLPMKSFYSEIDEILRTCEKVGIETKIPTDLFSRNLARSTISLYGDLPVIDFYTSPKMTIQLFIKRILDIVTSGILLLLLTPVFIVVCFLIKATSAGAVFFKQTRVGYNGRIFDCLKFRTMVKNAEQLKDELIKFNEMEGPVFKIRNDPRATKVGPRPPVPEEVNQYDLKDRKRLSMRPGITCFWQINGRNRISFEKWMELDRQYIDQWSLWLDFKVLLKTIPVVLRGSGAS
jgi:lipopolysaccharide/colanic/teichoic acid biosynthesis glycosyltransferase